MLCTGDVNGSYIPLGFKEASSLTSVEDELMTVPLNEPFIYNISSSREAELGAMTLFLSYDQDRFEVIDIVSKLDGMKYVTGNGKISIAWSDTKSLKVNSGDLLVSLKMQVKQKLPEPSRVFTIKTGSEFADIHAIPYDNFAIKMSQLSTAGGNKDITLSNYPNPFSNTTKIVYTLPEAGHVLLLLTDMYGNAISTLADQQELAGSHIITVDPAGLHLSSGVYLYKIIFESATDTFEKVNKMVFAR